PRRRPGRPRLSEMTENRGDEEIVKKVRQRIAQRSYRSRKQGALVLAEARASRLEGSLNKALQSFAQFQDYIIQKGPASLPPDILLHLSKTAVKLTTIAQRARSDNAADNNGEQTYAANLLQSSITEVSRPLLPWLNPDKAAMSDLQHGLNLPQDDGLRTYSLTYRMLHACLLRAIAIFSHQLPPKDWDPPSVLLALSIARSDVLVTMSVRQAKEITDGYWREAQYTESMLNVLPKMYRTIEGTRQYAVPRSAPPKLQMLQPGRTRTVLQTTIPDLKGEWLEACDVEEYLAERGICVRGEDVGDMLELVLPSVDSVPPLMYDSTALTRAGFTIFGRADIEGQHIPSGLWSFTPSPQQYADFSTLQQQQNAVDQNLSVPAATPSARITINLDKLVSVLASNAVCLGPAPGIQKGAVDLAIRESV
ncbi:hypothetical protein BGZ61DRAFT_283949, partial [Ilyonectria robusta]|uniref:uncharacterized protein n=1 Tax=Ilyonectria robusta TaxID=1079257 RepID=UPI001E8E4756